MRDSGQKAGRNSLKNFFSDQQQDNAADNCVVATPRGSCILICHQDKAQELKKVITALNENSYEEIL